METLIILSLIACVVLGAIAGYFFGRARGRENAAQLAAALDIERRSNAERLAGLKDSFSALAADALRKNSEGFLTLAGQAFGRYQQSATSDLEKRQKAIEELVKPVKDTLDRFELNVREIEKNRIGAYESLTTQVKSLFESQQDLRLETANLVNSLKTPHVRGRWGEIQLRRVVEMAGMIDHCDFVEQQSVATEAGRLRPDMTVRLPGSKTIIVDAKSPLSQYLAGMEAADDVSRQMHLAEYAGQIRSHVAKLSAKAYWDQFPSAPEFVFMFLPGESFFFAALQIDPSLIEVGVAQRVIIATPITLIALLKSVSYGWRQEKLAADVEKIGSLGKEIYERVCKMGDHFVALGSSLRTAVERYNDTLGTLESRVLVSARRFKEMPIAATDKDVKDTVQIDAVPRQLQAPDLKPNGEQSIVVSPMQ